MTLQLGICYISQGRRNLRSAVNDASQALETATSDNNTVIYDNTLKQQLKERHEREKKLEAAEVNNDFVTYYQPKVDISIGNIVGAEALVRMIDPEDKKSIKAPWYFVPYYEQTGKIAELDFFVFESVCKMLRRRMDANEPVVTISCNFSRKHFTKPGFTEKFLTVIDRYQISKDLIEIEITETMVVEKIEHHIIKNNLEKLRSNNIRLSIDDFGAGYSSLGIFEDIPSSVIKLDRSFFTNKNNPERQEKIMRDIMKMADELDVATVCEGVETEDDLSLMKKIGANVAQGYYYFKPMPEADFEEKLSNKEGEFFYSPFVLSS